MQDFIPVLLAVDDDENLLCELLRLREGEDLKQLVERAEAAGKNDQRFGEIREPVLAHEEVVKLEVEIRRDVAVGILLERQADVQSDGFAAGFAGAAVGGFHDARTAA